MKSKELIPFTKEDIRLYLSENIFYWRNIRDTATDKEKIVIATYYIDAYQSVFTSIYGCILE